MAFGNFKDVQEVARLYQVSIQTGTFVKPIPMPVSKYLSEELEFSRAHFPVRASEASICEFLILPVLREVSKGYLDSLLMWSHAPLGMKEPLIGTPDYYFARRSPLGFVSDKPYVLVVEAKKDDFDAGWAQCLAAMLAAQEMNGAPQGTLYGSVSNGTTWEFGKLEGKGFLAELRQFYLADLPGLFAAWNHVLAQAKEQALAPAA
jgi:hypothetical protein